MLAKIIDRSIKPFLILAGLATASVGVLLIAPQTLFSVLFGLPLQQDYILIIQHWSFMISLVGIILFLAAFFPRLRFPIMLFALIEKLGLIVLGVIYIHLPATKGFFPAILMDSLISLYLILYFISHQSTKRRPLHGLSSS